MVMYDDLHKSVAATSNVGYGNPNILASPKRRVGHSILDTIHIVSRIVGGEL
jgi:hypothetical protein